MFHDCEVALQIRYAYVHLAQLGRRAHVQFLFDALVFHRQSLVLIHQLHIPPRVLIANLSWFSTQQLQLGEQYTVTVIVRGCIENSISQETPASGHFYYHPQMWLVMRSVVSVCLSRCLTVFVSCSCFSLWKHWPETACWYAGTSSQYLSQVRISQGHRVKFKSKKVSRLSLIHTHIRRWSAFDWNAILFLFL